MKKLLFFLLLANFFPQHLFSQDINRLGKSYTTDWRTLTKDYITWYTYTYYNIRLSQDFIGLDVDSVVIDKTSFLNKLLTGKLFAFKIGTKGGQDVYKLYHLTTPDESTKSVIKEMASTEMQHYKMEGMQLPAFNWTDTKGMVYDSTSTHGKLIVLKCWFISCVACVKEFPELNQLVNKYKGNENILFISLAIDRKDDLVKFLKKKKFKYVVVPEMKDFMSTDLNITQYPTHLLIGKTGKIIKVVNRIEDLIPYLEKASNNFTLTQKIPG